MEAGRSGIQGHSLLNNEFQAILGYMRLSQQTKQSKKNSGLRDGSVVSKHLLPVQRIQV